MLDLSHTAKRINVGQPKTLQDSTMSRISLRSALASRTPQTKLTPKQRNAYLNTSSDINIGAHSRWLAAASKLQQQEILQGLSLIHI